MVYPLIIFGSIKFLYVQPSRQSVWANFSRHEKIGYDKTARLVLHILTELPVADSVTRSPLYSIYGETIAGVTILRAFGASSKFLRDMLRCVDTVSDAIYHFQLQIHRYPHRMQIRTIGCGEVGGILCY
jgi:hypothetical protein